MKSKYSALFFVIIFIALNSKAQKVGINQPVPLMTLHINSADSAALLLVNTQAFADSIKTALYFATGTLYTGAIKTHVQNGSGQLARMGFFTFAGPANGLKERLSITDNGNVGIGTVSPSAKLDISGSLKIANGTQGLGKVLTSDAAGNTSWQNIPSGTDWSLSGNSATTSANFLGTTDANPLRFQVQNYPAGYLDPVTRNLALGVAALKNNPGTSMVAIGDSAMYNQSNSSSGYYNIAIGTHSLFSNITGKGNTATGFNSLYLNTADYNSAVGSNSLENNTTGTQNNAIGYSALLYNVTGSNNTAVGAGALYRNTGTNNTAVGAGALFENTAYGNTAVGQGTLSVNTTGVGNTALGVSALSASTADYNTATGAFALKITTTGTQNTAMGYNALAYNVTGSNNTAIGSGALYQNTADGNTAVGQGALFTNTSQVGNTAIGASVLSSSTANYNTGTGAYALKINTTGTLNTAMGYEALANNTTGSNNTAIGSGALYQNTADGNTAVGQAALFANTSGTSNSASGHSSLSNNTTGSFNTANGDSALRNNNASHNTAIGYSAALNISTGIQNVSVGSNSMLTNTTGSFNTAVGYNTGPNAANYGNTTCIGIDATATGSDMVRIGNNFVGSIGGHVGWSTLSDGRFKENIKENVPGLNFITQLRPVTYTVNRKKINEFTGVNKISTASEDIKDPHNNALYATHTVSDVTTGFIAQEVEALTKKIGYTFSGVDKPKNEKDYYSLRYAEFVVPLVKAVQEQQKIIEEQNKKIDMLLKDMQALKAKLN